MDHDWKNRVRELMKTFQKKLVESWQYRAATVSIVVILACAVAWASFDTEGTDSANIAFSEGTIGKSGSVKTEKWQAVKGSEGALDKSELRNPFLPEHPTEEEQKRQQSSDISASSKIPSEKLTGVPSINTAVNMSQTANSALGQMPKLDKSVELQGIVKGGEGEGVLLLVGGDSKFLLAGETLQDCTLEKIRDEEAVFVINGTERSLQVGDRITVN